jgi:HlyD family secretion protein
VSGKIPGRISAVYVKKGDRGSKGQLLAELSSPEIEAKLGQARAAGRAAAAQKEKADRGARAEEVRAARSTWQRAEVAADLAEKTFARTARLYADGVISAQKYDEAKANAEAARQQAQAALAAYTMAKKGAREEDKAAAAALADQAAGVVAEVRAYSAETKLFAPVDGEVVDVLAERGEMISAGYPVIRLLDSSDFWMVFHVREDMLDGLKTGDFLKVDIPALKEKDVPLKVVYVSALGDFAVWKATKPPATLT